MVEARTDPVRTLPSPREMMRARRPYLFSDSETDQSLALSRLHFEYHLDSLTSRKQEYEFEDFCRKLAEKELCPNLTIQTGPTGGGDGKTDAETYPVAEEITERWWMGHSSAGKERWAFAFSAKKDWKPKCKSDIKKIAETERSYSVVYFITNQFAPDKDKAKIQDELNKLYAFRIVVLDRAWLTEKVYENGHLAMAIDSLAIDGAQSEVVRKLGPSDAARSAELLELDQQIADPERYNSARFQLASDCLRSAILARGLERPKGEVEARFEQAIKIADENGSTQQAMRIRYHYGWTAFWWFEDFPKLSDLYDQVESRLEGASFAADAKYLYTLWSIIEVAVFNDGQEPETAKLEKRKETLVSILEPLAQESGMPNNALEAQTYLALIEANAAIREDSKEAQASCWLEFERILDESEPLGTFPVEMLEGVFSELGQVIDTPEFDTLYTKMINVIRKRRSEGMAGEAYCNRAFQKLEHDKPYEAIRWFGRAEELLIKEEYQNELMQALLGSGAAYSMVDLHWAARNRAMAALVHSMQEFRDADKLEWPAWIAIKQLIWAELRLGRIPHALAAMKMAKYFVAGLQPNEELAKNIDRDQMIYEAAFGLLLLRLKPEQLESVSLLHDGFAEYGLEVPGMATLLSLGREDVLKTEGYIPEEQSEQEVSNFLDNWLNIPGAEYMQRNPMLFEEPTVELTSNVLGCEIRVVVEPDPVSLGIAETILGGIECFMATSEESDVHPHREMLPIILSPNESGKGIPEYHLVEETGASFFEVNYPPKFEMNSREKIQQYRDWLQAFLIDVVSNFSIIRDVKAWLERVAGEERGFSRALAFSDMLTTNGNIFGANPPIKISDHFVEGARSFEPRRQKSLLEESPDAAADHNPQFATGDPPKEFIKPEDLKHSDRRVLSPIQLDLWNQAGWHGTAFMMYPNMPGPILALHFRDQVAARRIFEDWTERWGREQSDENVRLSIVTGVTKQNPFAYSVQVGPVYRATDEQSGKTFTTLSRILRLDATTPDNLNNFMKEFQKTGSFGLAPATMVEGQDFPQPMFDLLMPRRRLEIRAAWTIDEHDPDLSVLQDDDEPIVPDDQSNPPVFRAMERLKAFRASSKR